MADDAETPVIPWADDNDARQVQVISKVCGVASQCGQLLLCWTQKQIKRAISFELFPELWDWQLLLDETPLFASRERRLIYTGFVKTQQFTSLRLAIKQFEDESAELFLQLNKMGSLQHPGLVRVLGVLREPWRLVWELYPLGCLSFYLQHNVISRTTLFKLLYQVSETLEFLHSQSPPIVYGSLDTSSVFVVRDSNGELSPKLGYCKRVQTPNGEWLTVRVFTPWIESRLSTEVDVRSFARFCATILQDPLVGFDGFVVAEEQFEDCPALFKLVQRSLTPEKALLPHISNFREELEKLWIDSRFSKRLVDFEMVETEVPPSVVVN